MPIFDKRWALGTGRNVRLSLHVEAALTGVGATVGRLKSRLGLKKTVGPPSPDGPARSPVDGNPPAPERLARELLADRDRKLKNVRRQLAVERRELEELRAESSNQGPPVFFVVGRAKSGTSWLMRTFNAHPEVLCTGEGRFFGRSYLREDFNEAKVKLQPRSLYGAIAESEYLRAWVERSPWTKDRDAEEQLVELTRLATRHFLEKRLVRSGKKIVGDKTPFTGAEVIPEITNIMPEAKVVHIIRDGRDVAISSAHHVWNYARDRGGQNDLSAEVLDKRDRYRADPEGFLANGESIFAGKQLLGTARNWAELVGRAREDGSALLGENYAEVRYEDLLQRPEEEVGRLLRFLGAEADEETVRRCVESASFESWAKGRERGREEFTSFLRKGVAGDWRGVFNEEDKKVFKEVAGGTLIELGYEEDGEW